MAEYHVGCGLCGIYAGTINKNKTTWINKTDVTDEAVSAVAQWLLQQGEIMRFECGGEIYILSVSRAE